jgi:Rrf2 family protein
MRISTRARYGMRVMLELALAHGAGPVRVKDIAKRQALSMKYIEHLIAALKGAGLVRARRGAGGGYVLGRPPRSIRLLEIFRLLEGPVGPVECLDDPKNCPRSAHCATRALWASVGRAMTQVLGEQTLEDLAENQRRGDKADAPMYHI